MLAFINLSLHIDFKILNETLTVSAKKLQLRCVLIVQDDDDSANQSPANQFSYMTIPVL